MFREMEEFEIRLQSLPVSQWLPAASSLIDCPGTVDKGLRNDYIKRDM
jgi:hypothetical protein